MLIREPDHNVTLRSGNFTLRFFNKYGGTPLQWWSEPFPLLTNDFPGSGVSVAWEQGQDPTQASANGISQHPICTFSDPSSLKHNYYTREYLFDEAAGKYGVAGFLADFWLSHEAADDTIPPNIDDSDTGWRTKYNPGKFLSKILTSGCPVIFQGSRTNRFGIFSPGNEMIGPIHWASRLRNYLGGRVAFKTAISLSESDRDSYAGVLFWKKVPESAVSKNDFFYAPGLHLYFYRSGKWALSSMVNNSLVTIASAKLSKAHRKKLTSTWGAQIEIRTDNNQLGIVDLFIDDSFVSRISVPANLRSPHVGLFASTKSGYIVFNDRRFFDVGVMFESLYSALPNSRIVSEIKIKSTSQDPLVFYRGGSVGVFMNQVTFQGQDRACKGLKNGTWHNIHGIYLTSDYEAYWVGNQAGNIGICGKVESMHINEQDSPQAHLLIDNHAINDEFVLMFNSLPLSANYSPVSANSLGSKITWQTRISPQGL